MLWRRILRRSMQNIKPERFKRFQAGELVPQSVLVTVTLLALSCAEQKYPRLRYEDCTLYVSQNVNSSETIDSNRRRLTRSRTAL